MSFCPTKWWHIGSQFCQCHAVYTTQSVCFYYFQCTYSIICIIYTIILFVYVIIILAVFFSVYIASTVTRERDLTEIVPPGGKKSLFSIASVTYVSGEIFIWPSTIRHSELERIIHSSIISLPLCGPLLSDLLAFPAFPQLQRFIPAAATICINPAIVALWLQKKRMKLGQLKARLGVLRSQCKQRKRDALKVHRSSSWLSSQWEQTIDNDNLWSFEHV